MAHEGALCATESSRGPAVKGFPQMPTAPRGRRVVRLSMTACRNAAERHDDRSERSSAAGARPSVQSVDRAVSVLEILAKQGEAGVTEIAEELDVHKSTAFRLLGVLENRGLVEQEKDRGKYYLGAGVLRLAGAAAVRLDISQEGVPVCRELAEELGETANIAVLDDDAAVNIMQARGSAVGHRAELAGQTHPAARHASGKVLLAHLPAAAPGGPARPQAAAVHRAHPDHGGRAARSSWRPCSPTGSPAPARSWRSA